MPVRDAECFLYTSSFDELQSVRVYEREASSFFRSSEYRSTQVGGLMGTFQARQDLRRVHLRRRHCSFSTPKRGRNGSIFLFVPLSLIVTFSFVITCLLWRICSMLPDVTISFISPDSKDPSCVSSSSTSKQARKKSLYWKFWSRSQISFEINVIIIISSQAFSGMKTCSQLRDDRRDRDSFIVKRFFLRCCTLTSYWTHSCLTLSLLMTSLEIKGKQMEMQHWTKSLELSLKDAIRRFDLEIVEQRKLKVGVPR